MEKGVLRIPHEQEFNQARQLYLEQFGSAIVANAYLKVALFCLSLVCLGLLWLNLRTARRAESVKPLVIRVDEVGRAEAIRLSPGPYRPRDAEVRYFLRRFVIDHFSRIRATVKESYSRSLYFLDRRLAEAAMEAGRRHKAIEEFLVSGQEEIDVEVRNVVIEDLREPPYKATVDYEKVFYSRDGSERRRERYTASFVFAVKEQVPNALIPVNPLGLTISYFREDQAFQ